MNILLNNYVISLAEVYKILIKLVFLAYFSALIDSYSIIDITALVELIPILHLK